MHWKDRLPSRGLSCSGCGIILASSSVRRMSGRWPAVSTTAAGCILSRRAAGLAVGYWKDQDELRSNWIEDKRWLPKMSQTDRDARYAMWKRAVERSLGWIA